MSDNIRIDLSDNDVRSDEGEPSTYSQMNRSEVVNFSSGSSVARPGSSVVVDKNSPGPSVERIKVVRDDYLVLSTDEIIVGNKSTDFSITLLPAEVGRYLLIKNIGIGRITITAFGIDTIDNETTQTLSQWDTLEIQCYSTNEWAII